MGGVRSHFIMFLRASSTLAEHYLPHPSLPSTALGHNMFLTGARFATLVTTFSASKIACEALCNMSPSFNIGAPCSQQFTFLPLMLSSAVAGAATGALFGARRGALRGCGAGAVLGFAISYASAAASSAVQAAVDADFNKKTQSTALQGGKP